VTFNRAMQKSCNAYFADLAVKAGYEAMCDAAEELHFGTRLGLDFEWEGRGVVPNPEWWAKVSNRPFSRGDLVNMGCGQGELLVTPLQMASLIATVANDGKQMRPRFVRAIRDANGKVTPVEPEVIGEIAASPEFWSIMKNSLEAVVSGGTARGGRIQGITMAGKTGSAENAHGPLTHSWFVAYAPADNPQIAIAVMAENAGHGGTVAVPMASSVIRKYLEKDPPKPAGQAEQSGQSNSNAPKIEVSDPLPIVN
jgi:penicillin-binding protein 2